LDFLDPELNRDWLKTIEKFTGQKTELLRVGIVGGGSINDARKIDTTSGSFFAKINSDEAYPGMFEAEAKGLVFLKENSSFNIPIPLGTGVTEGVQWILMENINRAVKSEDYWEKFGQRLAEMHRHSNSHFGFDGDNYLGSLRQLNEKKDSWPEFFSEMRLKPQLKWAKENGEATTEMLRLFEKVFNRIENIFPKEPPAAVHGDLWTGNFMTGSDGEAVIFDPAAYYGHREMDLGMSKLFGGFDKRFYEAYHDAYPLEKGWEERIHIANLYPLMAHVNLFGGSYTSQVVNILRKYA
jgi:fructosamine-3-kinase